MKKTAKADLRNVVTNAEITKESDEAGSRDIPPDYREGKNPE